MKLTEEEKLFTDSIKAFLEKEINPHVDSWEENHGFPSEILKKFGDNGYLSLLVSEADGGLGLGHRYAALWSEVFGSVRSLGFTTAVNMHGLVITPTVARFCTDEAKKIWLDKAMKGEVWGAYAFTEPGAGSDLSSIRTTAKKDGDDYIINGSKIFITNGARADFVLVLTKTNPAEGYKGFSTFIVDTKLPGFSVSRKLDKLGWHASDTAELVFDNVRVSKSALLGNEGEGWKQAMASLEWERLMLSLLSLGGANACLGDTIRYVNDRKVFGKKVADYSINRDRLILSKAKLDVSKSMIYSCVDKLVKKENCRKEVSELKRYICEEAFLIAHDCLQLHGGYGYCVEFSAERWLRDLRLNTLGGGTQEIMERVAVKELLAG